MDRDTAIRLKNARAARSTRFKSGPARAGRALRYALGIVLLIVWGCVAYRAPAGSPQDLPASGAGKVPRAQAAACGTDTDNGSGQQRADAARQPIESPAYVDYRIQAGDTIEISVWGEPDMTRTVVVMPDGTISYFLIGEVTAVGKTFKDLRETLEQRLAQYILHPKVTLIGQTFAGTFATILGAVNTPGRHDISQRDRVLDIIAKAGGLKYVSSFGADFSYAGDIANLKMAYLSRKGRLVDVDFVALIEDGDMSQNVPVYQDDFIYIPSSLAEQIYVLGEVLNPTTVPYRAKTTLMEAIVSAGGFDEKTASKSRVCIVRGGPRSDRVIKVDFQKIVTGREPNLVLDPGDIVYVPSTFMTDLERLSSKIIPFLDAIIMSDSVLDIGQRRWNTFNPYRAVEP